MPFSSGRHRPDCIFPARRLMLVDIGQRVDVRRRPFYSPFYHARIIGATATGSCNSVIGYRIFWGFIKFQILVASAKSNYSFIRKPAI